VSFPKALWLFLLASSACAPEPAPEPATDALAVRFEGAERVVVGSVAGLRSGFGTNEHGDRLILTRVTLEVRETLRGEARRTATFEMEGGSVGEVTLEVSDMPTLATGERGVFALRRSAAGIWVPNRRGLGILRGPGLDLERVRRVVTAGVPR